MLQFKNESIVSMHNRETHDLRCKEKPIIKMHTPYNKEMPSSSSDP